MNQPKPEEDPDLPEDDRTPEEIETERLEDEHEERRTEIKTEVTKELSESLYDEMDEKIAEHFAHLSYGDTVDIMVGIVQSCCIMQLEQVTLMKNEESFNFLKMRWHLVTLEFLKSVSRKKYNPVENSDPKMDAQIKEFEAQERKINLAIGNACKTEGCPQKKEEDLEYCLPCVNAGGGS